jgi:dihydropteroate synthase
MQMAGRKEECEASIMIIGNREFDLNNRTYIMGILNMTPDSFSDGGRWNELDAALRRVEDMIQEGADIIDVGGESTRPGHNQISENEECERVVPIIQKIRSRFDVPISIDTCKSRVAEAALQAGAHLVNDIWGFKYDNEIAAVTAKYDAYCCLMHNKEEAVYENFMQDVLRELQESVEIAKAAGISKEKIILDPGVGFAKSYQENLEAIRNVDRLHELQLPILLGTSRKSCIGLTLNLPSDERVEGTIATTVIGVMRGCAFVRVHDIKENKRAIQMTEAIIKSC